MEYIITYDLGTSSIKCGLFDTDLHCLVVVSSNYGVRMTVDGRAEAEPEDYIMGMAECTKKALEKTGIPKEDIKSLCVTTQGETLIPVDINGRALYSAIVWLDGRAAEEAKRLQKVLGDKLFKQKTGLPRVDGFTPLAKLLHIKSQMPDVFEKTNKFLLLEDYITFCLTGRIVSEKSLLSSTGYFNLETDELWQEALELIGVDKEMIPEVVEPGERIGTLTSEAAIFLGLTTETTVYAGAMDQLAGAVGCGNYEVGAVHETTGTAMIVATTMGFEECMKRNHELTVYRHVEKDKYLLLAIGRTATTVLKWFVEQFYSEHQDGNIYEYLSEVVARGTVGANGVLMSPYFEGLIGDETAGDIKGVFWNVGLHNTREDFVRAIYEGVSYMLKDNIQLLFENKVPRDIVSIGGASKSDIWCQIKADVTKCNIITMTQEESALFGCACIAAVGSGIYKNLHEAVNKQGKGQCFVPESEKLVVYQGEYQKYCMMKQILEYMYQKL